MSKRRTLIIMLLLAGLQFRSPAQVAIAPSVINSSGGSYSRGYYHLDWSIGELALVNQMSSANQNLIVTNGLIQPFTQYPNTRNDDAVFGEDEIIILPNPTADVLEINFRTQQMGKIRLVLFDVRGHRVYQNQIRSSGTGSIEKINMTRMLKGTYFLHVQLEADIGFVSKRGVYKIIKIQ